MNRGHTTHWHTIRIILVSFGLLLAGLVLLAIFWLRNPVQAMKLEYFFESYAANFKYGDIEPKNSTNASAQEIPVLLYHGIFENKTDGFNISQDQFYDHMIGLKKAGYSTIDMETYLAFRGGDVDLPEKSILITFDDGRKDSYYRADPILKALDFQAVMFLTSDYSVVDGSNYYIDQHELKRMHKSGRWDIESHSDRAGTNQIPASPTRKANFFGQLKWLEDENRTETINEYRKRVGSELSNSKKRLEEYLGAGTIRTFAFPFGDYGQRPGSTKISDALLDEAAKYYEQAFVQFRKGEPYSSNYHEVDSFISRRIEVEPKLSGAELVSLLGSSTAKPVPFKAKLNENDGWKNEWGDLDFENGALVISSSGKSTSAAVYLDGTRRMSSYKAEATAYNQPDTTVKLVMYEDGKNYIGCRFDNERVAIENMQQGKRDTVAINESFNGSINGKALGIEVDPAGNIKCFIDGHLLVRHNANSVRYGGPAITVWNPKAGKAGVKITEFTISHAIYGSGE